MIRKCSFSVLVFTFMLGSLTPGFSASITLEQAIREVCTNSDSVKMMNETIKKSDEMVREKYSNALPVISANGTVAHSYGSLSSSGSSGSSRSSSSLAKQAAPNPSDPATKGDISNAITGFSQGLASQLSNLSEPAHTDIYSTSLSFSQTVYSFGKVSTAVEVAKNFNKSVHCNFERNMQTLQLSGLDVYFMVLIKNKLTDISAKSLIRKKDLNSFLERNFQMGSGSRAQVLKTRADVASQTTDLLIAKRDAKTARMQFNMFLGRDLLDATEFDTTTFLPAISAEKIPEPSAAVAAALENRTDLQSMKYLSESNKGGAKIFDAMYLPSIGASGSVGYSKTESSSSLMKNNGNPNWSLGLGAQWTLFDGFANSAKANQYKSDSRKLDIAYNSIIKMMEIEIRTAVEECYAADSNFSASKEMYNAAKESYELTESNFKQGSGQISDLQLSDELLQQSELGIFNAKYRLIRSRAALQVAMGKSIVQIDKK